MQNDLDLTASRSPNYLSREEFILLCPAAFLHGSQFPRGVEDQSLTTDGSDELSCDTDIQLLLDNLLYGDIVTAIDETPSSNDESTVIPSSGESSASSPQKTPVLENANPQSGSLPNANDGMIPGQPILRVNSLIDPRTKIQCDRCEKQVSAKNLIAHLVEVHDPYRNKHMCGVCGKSYFRLRDLTKHRKDKHCHVAYEPDRHVCGICNESFTDVQMLKIHRKTFYCILF